MSRPIYILSNPSLTSGIQTQLSGGYYIYIESALINTNSSLVLDPASASSPLIDLTNSGVILGGSIVDTGGGLIADGGTLSGVTYFGVLSLTYSSASSNLGTLHLANGFSAFSYNGKREIDLSGGLNNTTAPFLFVDDTMTLDNDTVNVTNGVSTIEQWTTLAAYNASGGRPTESLTLGPNLNIVVNGTTQSPAGLVFSSGGSKGASGANNIEVENKGVIDVSGVGTDYSTAGGLAAENLSLFKNSGTIRLNGNSSFSIDSDDFVNTGTITVGAGANLDFLDLNGSVYTTAKAFGGTIDAAAGTVTLRGGTILDNTGQTLSVGAGSHIGLLNFYTGLIEGGNIVANTSGFPGGNIAQPGSGFLVEYQSTLSGLNFDGSLVVGEFATLTLASTVAFAGLDGTGQASMLLGFNSQLSVDNTQTLDNVSIAMTAISLIGNPASIVQNTTAAAVNGLLPLETLTLGAQAAVNLIGDGFSGAGVIGSVTDRGAVVNQGFIEVADDATLTIDPAIFTNAGTILADRFGVVKIGGGSHTDPNTNAVVDDFTTNLSNDAVYGGDVLSGGTYEVKDSSQSGDYGLASHQKATIEFDQIDAKAITSLNAIVELTGANVAFRSNGSDLSATLRNVAQGAALDIAYDSTANTQAVFNSTSTSLILDGAIGIFGAQMTAQSLIIDVSGILTGVGESHGATAEDAWLTAPIANLGTLRAGQASAGNPVGSPEARFYVGGPIDNSSGYIEIEGSTILELSGVETGGHVVFENTQAAAPAKLVLDAQTIGGAGAQVTGTIYGFQKDDAIDLTASKFNVANLTGHNFDGATLTLNYGAETATLSFSGLAANTDFQFLTDGGNGTEISIACFARGAHIATARGEVAVEALQVGDLVVTASGALRPVTWLGSRRLDISRHPAPREVWPIRVEAGAFGDNLPRRDLWLSPGHNIAAEGALMPISALVNGLSVAQVEQDAVEYWHVELDAHDVILAEGLPAESYLDTGNRTAFANGGAFIEAHPDFAPKHWAETCLPLVFSGEPVARIKARLLARLAARGFEITTDADAHLKVDGRRVEPTRLSNTRLAFVLPAGGQQISLCSNRCTPAHMAPENEDQRRLGLSVARLQIDGAAFDLGEPKPMPGWHEAEYADGRFTHRWTQGETPLRPGARVVIVDLAGSGACWRAPPPAEAMRLA